MSHRVSARDSAPLNVDLLSDWLQVSRLDAQSGEAAARSNMVDLMPVWDGADEESIADAVHVLLAAYLVGDLSV